MRGLRLELFNLAKAKRGAFVSHETALERVFGLAPNGNGGKRIYSGADPAVRAARKTLYGALYTMKEEGLIRTSRGAFALPDPAAPVKVLPTNREPRRLAPAGPRVEHRLNRLALVLDAAHEELSELRHDLSVAEREDARPTFPMRCSEPGEREG